MFAFELESEQHPAHILRNMKIWKHMRVVKFQANQV
jgi:hypothetical protein